VRFLLLKCIDQRVHTPCPQLLNNILALIDADGKTVSEMALLYKPNKPVTGSLVNCPNSIGKIDHYVSKYSGFIDGFIL
jgi:hypothetical protein